MVTSVGPEVLLAVDPVVPDLAAQLDGYAPDLLRRRETVWSVPSAPALVRVLDRLAVAGFERIGSVPGLMPFPWPGDARPARLPDLRWWHGRSLAAFIRRHGPPTVDIAVHSSTSGSRYVARRGFYSAEGLQFVVETDSYPVITLTGSKPPPRSEDLVISHHTEFVDAAALQIAIDRWPRDL